MSVNQQQLLHAAQWVILLFDQANTNQAVEKLGSRGELLKGGVDDLRKVFADAGINPYDACDDGTWREGWRPRPTEQLLE